MAREGPAVIVYVRIKCFERSLILRIQSRTSSCTASFPVRAAMRFLLETFHIMLSNVGA